MKFFDYIFYRSYFFYKRHDDWPMFTSVVIIAAEILVLTSCFWGSLLNLMLPNMLKHIYAISWTFFFVIYYRYSKRKDIIFQEFKNSKYNKSIPDWMCIGGTIISSIILGIIMLAYASAYIEKHNFSGILLGHQ